MRMYVYSIVCWLFLPLWALAQSSQQIKGRVISRESKLPLQAVTVAAQQQQAATQTNKEGNFVITASGTDTLYITHAGYNSLRIPVSGGLAQPLLIELEVAAKELEEVLISTGYQSVPKERSTGAYNSLGNALLSQQVSTGILERLEAVANGLSVGRKNNTTPNQLMIRGLSTINGPKDPLIIVDNFPYEGDIGSINPNDVESITLLKDAAAASIWGARAGNGVIVITTKKGKYSQPLQVELNTSLKITEAPDLYYFPRISSSALIDVEQFLFSKGWRFADTASLERPPFSPVYEILFRQRKGLLSAAEATEQINALRGYDVREQFNRYFYQNAISQQYALNLKGGSQNMAWLLSGGVDRNVDNLDAAFNRLTLRSENRIRLTKKISLSTGLYWIQSNSVSGKPGYSEIRQYKVGLPSYTRFADDAGNALSLAKDYRSSYTDTAGGGNLLNWQYLPLEEYRHTRKTNRLQNLLATAGLSYNLFKGLTADLKYQYQRQQLNGQTLYTADSYFARDRVNRFYQPFAANKFPVPKGGILDLSEAAIESQNGRGQLNYEQSWKQHSIVALAGAELRQTRTTGTSSRFYGYNNENGTYGKVDFANTYPGFVTGSPLFIDNNQSLSEQLNRFVSVFANAAYTYRQRYTVSLSGRRDASNTFGVRTNDKWTPLWSAGASWDIAAERFYKLKAVSYLRLRITYGFSGNVDPSLSAQTTIRYSSSNPFSQTPTAETDRYYNPDLRWEKSRQFNAALDFKAFNNRLWGSLDVYQKKGTDLYGPALLDYTTGLGVPSITKNVAAMLATGADIELNSINLKGAFTWTSNLNLSLYKDRVTAYYLRSLQGSNFVGDGIGISGLVGKPVNAVFSYQWAGLDPLTGDPQGFDASKQVSKNYGALTGSAVTIDDLVDHGPAMPKHFGSLGNTVSWKGLAVTVRFIYKFGHYFRRPSVNYNSLFSSLEGHADFSNRWQVPGDETRTSIPSMVYPLVANREAFYQNAAVLVEKADLIRLQYITLAYSLTREQVKQLPVQAVQLYANLNDLGLIWRANKHQFDPDYTMAAIPPSKNIAVGVRVNF